jgi:hypothetical protein
METSAPGRTLVTMPSSFLDVARELLTSAEAKAAYAADPGGFIAARGLDALTPADFEDALEHVADAVPPPVAAALAPGEGGVPAASPLASLASAPLVYDLEPDAGVGLDPGAPAGVGPPTPPDEPEPEPGEPEPEAGEEAPDLPVDEDAFPAEGLEDHAAFGSGAPAGGPDAEGLMADDEDHDGRGQDEQDAAAEGAFTELDTPDPTAETEAVDGVPPVEPAADEARPDELDELI